VAADNIECAQRPYVACIMNSVNSVLFRVSPPALFIYERYRLVLNSALFVYGIIPQVVLYMGLYRRSFCIWGYTAGRFVYGAIPQVILYMGLYRRSFCIWGYTVGHFVYGAIP
jgi:hypothetical protein